MRARTRRFSAQASWVSWLAVLITSAVSTACSDDEATTTPAETEQTSGSEDPGASMTSSAKPMPKREAGPAQNPAPGTTVAPRPDAPSPTPVPTLVAADPDPSASSGPSPWGAPEGE
jgi:hypothetical protein